MKKETRKARLRRLSYQVANAKCARYEHCELCNDTRWVGDYQCRVCPDVPVVDAMASAYERGYKQCMADLRKELKIHDLPAMSVAAIVATTSRFLGGVR